MELQSGQVTTKTQSPRVSQSSAMSPNNPLEQRCSITRSTAADADVLMTLHPFVRTIREIVMYAYDNTRCLASVYPCAGIQDSDSRTVGLFRLALQYRTQRLQIGLKLVFDGAGDQWTGETTQTPQFRLRHVAQDCAGPGRLQGDADLGGDGP